MVTTEPNLKKKKGPKETGEKQHLFFYADVTKIQKTRVVQALRASLHLRMRTVAKNLRLPFEVHVESTRKHLQPEHHFLRTIQKLSLTFPC